MSYHELIVLIPSHSLEDFPTELTEQDAAGLLNAFAALWRPELLVSANALPKWRRADDPLEEPAGRLVFVPSCSEGWLGHGEVERLRAAGATVVVGQEHRADWLAPALAQLDSQSPSPDLVADFEALGSTWLQIELLTRQMRNYSQLDEHRFAREGLAAARAALHHDADATRKHLSECFDLLLECRERFYPVECFLLDLCLVNAEQARAPLDALIQGAAPVNLLAASSEWRTIVQARPELQPLLRAAAQQRIVEFLGGDEEEVVDASLTSVSDQLWRLQAGRRELQELFDVAPQVWARRRFGHSPLIPQLLQRLDYVGALHILLDDGLAPDDEQSQLLWEGTGACSIPAFSRIPLAADSAASILRFPQRMAESMDYDHTAAVAFARWPELRTPFFEDFRRMQSYAPVLGKFVTCSEFFSRADTPGRRVDFLAGKYLSPALIRASALGEADPVSRHTRYWRRQRLGDRTARIQELAALARLQPLAPDEPVRTLLAQTPPESSAERHETVSREIDELEQSALGSMTQAITGRGQAGPGVLIINSLSTPRRVVIEWPKDSAPPPPPTVVHRSLTANGGAAVVDLPPCGFLWCAAEPPPPTGAAPPVLKTPVAEGLLLRTEQFEVRLSDRTGGIAQIFTSRRGPNRLSQQVAVRFPEERVWSRGEGDDAVEQRSSYTSMQLRESRVVSAGPLTGEIETMGELVDESCGAVWGAFRQRTRVTRGIPRIDVDLALSLAETPTGNPWLSYVGCRFAWSNADAVLTASMQEGAQPASASRLEAPQYVEIASESHRTTILTHGAPFLRTTGDRMLDSILVVAGETARHFTFSIILDHPSPLMAAWDVETPPVVLPVDRVPNAPSTSGWLWQVEPRHVAILGVSPGAGENGVRLRLLETEGRRRLATLHAFRPIAAARQVDFLGRTISTASIADGAATLEVGAHELCDVELTWG